ncbi:MAG: 2-isopropylmalate synthase [Deltaproteobacteria bacterium]|nr:2-isopropylmalate synthase [Deltaproteobacteria bacterium]
MSTVRGPHDATRGVVHLVDATLREGEQTPGVWLTPDEKLELLELLGQAGVELVDACFPAVSADERRFLERAASRGGAPIVAASLRLRVEDVELAAACGCVSAFLIAPASATHRRLRLGLERDEIEDLVHELATRCKAAGLAPQLVLEDASRAAPADVTSLLRAGRAAGIERHYLCDTVGVWTPSAAAAAVRVALADLGPGAEIGVHCHNDFGMATANTVAALEAGARWATVTVNGIGERAGHASLAEVALATTELLGFSCGVDPGRLATLSEAVERATGIPVAVQAPVLGATAFRHESGMHVQGVLRDPATYEPIEPALLRRRREIVVGKHSGRSLLRALAEERGLLVDDELLARALERLKETRPVERAVAFERFRRARDRYLSVALGLPLEAAERVLLECGAVHRAAPSRHAVSSAR